MPLLKSLEEANEVSAVRLCEEPQRASIGDFFRLSPASGVFVWGRYVKRAKFFGADFESNLVYIYDAVGAERPSSDSLKPTNLLIGPVVVNNLGWVRGYWQIMESVPMAQGDVLPRHLFVHYAGRGPKDYKIVDENGLNVRQWRFWEPFDPRHLMQSGFSNFNHVDWLVRDLLQKRGLISSS